MFHVFPLDFLCGGEEEGKKRMDCRFFHSLMAVVSHWLHHWVFSATPFTAAPLMISVPSGNWWITITRRHIHVVENENSSSPVFLPFHSEPGNGIFSPKPPPELPMKGTFCKKHNFPSLLSFPCENVLSFGNSGGGQEGWIKNGTLQD